MHRNQEGHSSRYSILCLPLSCLVSSGDMTSSPSVGPSKLTRLDVFYLQASTGSSLSSQSSLIRMDNRRGRSGRVP